MQIDTHHRDYNLTEEAGPHRWFLPQQLNTSHTQGGGLNPLIECPCTDRITRTTTTSPHLQIEGTCKVRSNSSRKALTCLQAMVESMPDCEAAIRSLAPARGARGQRPR